MTVLDSKKNTSFLSGQKKYFTLLEKLYLARQIDHKMSLMVKQNKGTSFFISTKGHEMIGTICGLALDAKKDWVFPYYRDRSFVLAYGESPTELFAGFMARKASHHSQGRMMLDHFSDPSKHIACQSSCVGSQFLQAVGVAQSLAWQNKQAVVYVSAGDGATSQGDFHEALNFSCIHNLPIVFVIQDNRWAISVRSQEQTAGGSIAKMISGYPNLNVFACDGWDVDETQKAVNSAFEKARKLLGPSVLVAHVPRLEAHSNSDDQKKYKTQADFQEDEKRDPITNLENLVLEKGLATRKTLQELKDKIKTEVDGYAEEAEKFPFPDKKSVREHLFDENYQLPKKDSKKEPRGSVITMMDGLNHALIEEMEKNSRIVVFGQDVAHSKGGVFGITRTLTEKFGIKRCFNTPLAESTIIGIAIGMAQEGHYKPVVEIQFADYIWTGMNQLVNELSSITYRSSGEFSCPVVIRMSYGGYIQGGPYHSQSFEAVFCHIPGLKVVLPSNAADAKRLLKTAIIDPNPVIFLEHKALYRQMVFCAREEPSKNEYLEFGKAKIVREGSDITFIGWGIMIPMVHDIATRLAKEEGISVEIIDLRTLVPLDFDTILQSVKKTSKVLIAHEAPLFGGFGAELAAKIADKAFSYLDAPIKRIGSKECPVAFCKDLENEILPQKEDLEKSIRELANY